MDNIKYHLTKGYRIGILEFVKEEDYLGVQECIISVDDSLDGRVEEGTDVFNLIYREEWI